MVEYVLMPATFLHLDTLERRQFRENERQKSGLVQQDKSLRGPATEHDLVQFLRDTLLRDDTDTFFISRDRIKGLAVEVKT